MSSNVRKIAVVIPKYGLVGGAESFSAELTQRIAQDSRYEVHVFAQNWSDHSRRITFHKVPRILFPRFLSTAYFAYLADWMMARMNFDLIHSHERILRADLFSMHGIPHRIWITEVRNKRMGLFDRVTAHIEKRLVQNPACQRFLAVSSLVKEKFLQEYHDIHPNKVQVIHPGVDIQRFQRLNRDSCREEIRKHFGIGSQETVILFVSMNFELKGLDLLMMAVAKFISLYPAKKIKLLIVGKGDVKKFQKFANNLGIGDHVLFAGVVPQEKLDGIYLASDIFSLLSKFDTFGIAVLEAMGAFLPVIISNRVGAKDVIKEGRNGFIIENTAQAEEIANRIHLLTQEEIRQKLGEESFLIASQHTWEVAAEKVKEIYGELFHSRRDGSVFSSPAISGKEKPWTR